MSSTEGTPQIKRVCLRKEELELLSKDDLIEQWLLQEKYINSLELKSGEVENSELVSLRESEEKLKQQQLEATRRENILVMRLTTKEQEMQEYASQIQELKQSQVPTVAQLRAALLDPAVNLVFERMRKEVDALKARLEETQNELSAWKFTPDSNTGKRLMAKCRSLYQENEELGKMISAGRLAKLEGDLALQRNFSEEMKKSQTELDEFLQELDEDVEGMQSTIIYLQQKLREAKEQLKKLQAENDLLSNNPSYFSETNESPATLNKPKVNAEKMIEDSEIDSDSEMIPNRDPTRTNGDNSPYSLPINSPRTPTHSELLSTPEPEERTRVFDSDPVVPRLKSPRTPPGDNKLEETSISHSILTPELPNAPEAMTSPNTRVDEEDITDQSPRKISPSVVTLEKPNTIHENGLKQGVICYGHQSLLVGNPPVDFKQRETTLQRSPESPNEITTSAAVLNSLGNQQYRVEDKVMEATTECAAITDKVDSVDSFPLDLAKKASDFTVNHSTVMAGGNVIKSTPNISTEPSATNLPASLGSNESLSPVIVPKIRLLAAVRQNLDSSSTTPLSASSSSPPESPDPMPVSVSLDRMKRTRPLLDDEENTNRSSLDSIITSPKKRKLMVIESLSSPAPSSEVIANCPSSPTNAGDKDLSADIDTEVQVAQTLACWAAASSKERARPKSPPSDQRVTGLVGNGDAVDGSKIGQEEL